MSHIFNLDSPVMSFLSRLADLVWLNLLTLLCCIPVVTAGAALTALHYVSIKMVRNEESYLTRSFFKSFKENLLQATALWIIFLAIVIVAALDFRLIAVMEMGGADVMRIILCAIFFFFLCSGIYWLPLLSRFDNTVKNTIRNGCLVGILNFPKTIGILAIYGAFIALYLTLPVQLIPLIFLLGVSLPVYLASFLLSGIFKKMEPEEEISQSV